MDGPEANRDRARGLGAVVLLSLLVLVSVPFDLVPLLRGPAPYPPEWQWAFRPEGPARPLIAAALLMVAVLGLLAASGSGWAWRHRTATFRVLVTAAVVLGFLLQLALLVREPGPPLRTLLGRTRSPAYTSYHTVAISPGARDPRAFLRHHADRLPDWARWAKHAATHPPGPVLFYRGALAACEASPALTDGLLEAAGVPDRSFRPPGTRPARAAALLGGLVLGLLGALAAWPLAQLSLALGVERLASARLALLWALLPGPALQTPQLDQALALPVTGATALLLLASERPDTRAVLARGTLAGALGGLALFASYGAAAFLLIGGLAVLAAAHPARLRRAVFLAALAGTLAGLLALGVPALLGHDSLRALFTALSIHRESYTAPRSYALWLVFNPLDLALFLGVPVAVSGLIALPGSVSRIVHAGGGAPLDRFRLALFGGVACLLALGVTRGEVGRIWIPLMPLLLVACVGAPESPDRRTALVVAVLLGASTLLLGSYWII
jgi:hypothetical protein